MKKYDVYGIGNALVDTEYAVDDAFLDHAKLPKGIMTLIGEEERKGLIRLLEDEHEHLPIKQTGGGSAANTMVIVSQLGGQAFYSCKVAADSAGDFFVKDLSHAGVDTNLTDDREQGATGQCISMVTPDAERTLTTCLGITNFLSPSELNAEALKSSSYLYIEGYLVSSTTGFQAALEAQEIASISDIPISLTLSDPAVVDNFKANYDQLLSCGVDLLFCNHDEARLLTGAESVEDCVVALRQICKAFVITCGNAGSVAFDGQDLTTAAAVPTKAVDTTGAGDIFTGAFLYSLCRGHEFSEANKLANKFASKLVSRFGARLIQEEVDILIN
jgi:sugar/nucleoside kinase (ribokinase family)